MKQVSLVIVSAVYAAVVSIAGQAQAGILYGHGNWDETLYRIDTDTQTVTVVGVDGPGVGAERQGPEIEMDPTGDVVYMSIVDWDSSTTMGLTQIDVTTGLSSSFVPWSGIPLVDDADFGAATALEFVGSTLYGSFHEAGPEIDPGVLGTIDTVTGSITAVGEMTGMNRPAGGLEYVDGVMYSVTATSNGDSRLFTIDLATGITTPGAFITYDGEQMDSITALAYADGVMYTLENNNPVLYSVDLATGVMSQEFNMEFYMNSLTPGAVVVPEPSSIAMFGIGALGLFGYSRRRRQTSAAA